MGVRPPSNDNGDDPESIEFGIAAVDAHLRRTDLAFPATAEEVAAELGDERIPYDVDGNDVRLGEMLDTVDRERFETRQELLNALHQPFEAYRRQHGNGVLGQLRSLVPF